MFADFSRTAPCFNETTYQTLHFLHVLPLSMHITELSYVLVFTDHHGKCLTAARISMLKTMWCKAQDKAEIYSYFANQKFTLRDLKHK